MDRNTTRQLDRRVYNRRVMELTDHIGRGHLPERRSESRRMADLDQERQHPMPEDEPEERHCIECDCVLPEEHDPESGMCDRCQGKAEREDAQYERWVDEQRGCL